MITSRFPPAARPGARAAICRSISSCSWCSTWRKRSAVRGDKRRLDPLVALRLHRLPPRLEVERLRGEPIGGRVGERSSSCFA